jgi:Phage-related protein
MYEILFYKDKNDNEPIKDYIQELAQKKNSKDARIKLKKIFEYLHKLRTYGTRIGAPTVKHIEGDIWELRPTNNRIFFFYWKNDTFVLLHHFTKKTQKTPAKEIEQAQRNLNDFLERTE